MILVLIPLGAVVLGVAGWLAMRALGAFDSLGGEPSSGWRYGTRESRGPMSLRERVEDTPRGCLLTVIAVCGVWVVGWLIVLIVGLSLLS